MSFVKSINKRQVGPKNKFQLTELQREYVQYLLPKNTTLRVYNVTDEKRSRTPKKTDQIFDTDFFKETVSKNTYPSYNPQKKQKKVARKDLSKSNQSQSQKKNRNKKNAKKQHQPVNQSDKKQIINQKTEKNDSSQQRSYNTDLRHHHRQKRNFRNKQIKQQKSELINQIKNTQSLNSPKIENKKRNKMKLSEKNQVKMIEQNILKEDVSLELDLNRTVVVQKKVESSCNQIDDSLQQKNLPSNSKQSIEDALDESLGKGKNLSSSIKSFCLKFLNKLKFHKSSWPFRLPVNPIAQGVPNYLDIVYRPMDLKTIEKKICANKYEHISEFHSDINKIFLNSYKFNPRQTNYFKLTTQLQAYYYTLVQEIQANPSMLLMDQSTRLRTNKRQTDFTDENSIKKKKSYTHKKERSTTNLKDQSIQKISVQQIQQNNIQIKQTQNIKNNNHVEPQKIVKNQKIIPSLSTEKNVQKKLISKISEQKNGNPLKRSQKIYKQKPTKTKQEKKISTNTDNKDIIGASKSFSFEQKRKLREKILKLKPQYLENILLMMYQEDKVTKKQEFEYEIELNNLAEETLTKISHFIKQKQQYKEYEPTDLQKYLNSNERIYLF